MENNTVHTLLVREARRRLLEESLPRLRHCIDLLEEEEVWLRPNESSNSVGNLVLHVCGNARQWIISGLGGAGDIRRRSEEFSVRGPLPKTHLIELLDVLAPGIESVLDGLSETDLLKVYAVQGFQETGVGILVHVVEHFSYHVGQVGYFVKARKNLDLGYYSGLDLEKK